MKRLILFFFLLIVACGSLPDEYSILDRSNCVLPCWNGITAGQTTEKELLEILKGLPDIDQKTIKITNEPWNIFDNQTFFSFHQNWSLNQAPRLQGYVYIINNEVSKLAFCGEIKTSVGDIIEQIGEPENIISGNNFYGGRTVILVHPSKGVSFSYTTELDQLEINSDTQISCLEIFDPLLYKEMLEAKFFSNGYYNTEETLRVMYPWDGYGNLDEKYPPRQP
ncbi:MAG: hypothetical protein KJZ77_16135 [Anaerolineales bacterium]|nr:hypothetical protein [Anaerolineales bacterium]